MQKSLLIEVPSNETKLKQAAKARLNFDFENIIKLL